MALFGGLYFVGRGIGKMDFNLFNPDSDTPLLGGRWWLKKALIASPGFNAAAWITEKVFGIDLFDSTV